MRKILVSILCMFALIGCSNKVLKPDNVKKHYTVSYQLYDNSDKNKAEKLLFSQTKETSSSLVYKDVEEVSFGDLFESGNYHYELDGKLTTKDVKNKFNSVIGMSVKDRIVVLSLAFSTKIDDSEFNGECLNLKVPNLNTKYLNKTVEKQFPIVLNEHFDDYIIIVTINEI